MRLSGWNINPFTSMPLNSEKCAAATDRFADTKTENMSLPIAFELFCQLMQNCHAKPASKINMHQFLVLGLPSNGVRTTFLFFLNFHTNFLQKVGFGKRYQFKNINVFLDRQRFQPESIFQQPSQNLSLAQTDITSCRNELLTHFEGSGMDFGTRREPTCVNKVTSTWELQCREVNGVLKFVFDKFKSLSNLAV